MGRSLFVAGLQSAGVPGDCEATLARFERDVRALRSTFDELELVVAPELHLMALPPLLEEEQELAMLSSQSATAAPPPANSPK